MKTKTDLIIMSFIECIDSFMRVIPIRHATSRKGKKNRTKIVTSKELTVVRYFQRAAESAKQSAENIAREAAVKKFL
jgi:hypothetical protein